MSSRPRVELDPREATRRLLDGLSSGADVVALCGEIAELHPDRNTFPGEVYLQLAASALARTTAAGVGPIQYEGLRERHLAEVKLRGKENRKFQFAALCAGAIEGGLEPDLLDEVYWWRTDDFWRYALYATVAIIRASAEARGLTVEELVAELSYDAG